MATGSYDIVSIVKFQRCWRRYVQMETLVCHITTLSGTYGFIEERVRTTQNIEEMKSLLCDPRVLEQIGLILQSIHVVSGSAKHYRVMTVKSRIFLAMNLILYRTSEVFEEMDAPLFDISTKVSKMFWEICNSVFPLSTTITVTTTTMKMKAIREFPAILNVYMENFKRWKAKDGAKLKCRIHHALVALYQGQEEARRLENQSLLASVDFEIGVLREKLFKCAGQDGLDQFDMDHPSGSFSAPTTTPTTSSSVVEGGGSGRNFTNEQVTHELLLDPSFQFNADENLIPGSNVQNPVFTRMRENFQCAFWACLEDELNLEQPCYGRVLKVVGEIRDALKVITGSNDEEMSEIIDIDFIQGRIQTESFSFNDTVSMFMRILDMVKTLQSRSSQSGATNGRGTVFELNEFAALALVILVEPNPNESHPFVDAPTLS